MKKILSVTLAMSLIAVITFTSCSKKDEPKTFNGDFTKLTVELMESTLGVDSALIIDKLKKDGFVATSKDCYRNDSYGITYAYLYFKGGKLYSMDSEQEYKDMLLLKNKFREENDKLVNRNYAFFKGKAYDNEYFHIALCEKNPTDFQQIVMNADYPSYESSYSDAKIVIGLLQYVYSSGQSFGIYVSQCDDDPSIYESIASRCDN